MVFSSMIFLWLFLPLILFFYFIVKDKVKNVVLLIFSLLFYAWGEPKYILLMLLSIFTNYILGLLLHKYRKKYGKDVVVYATVIGSNIGAFLTPIGALAGIMWIKI